LETINNEEADFKWLIWKMWKEKQIAYEKNVHKKV
jgi:hypothetical protein